MNNSLLASAVSAVLLAAWSAWTMAQTPKSDGAASYPSRSIRLVVPVPPGGSSDGMARVLGLRLTEAWGQQTIIDNRAGASEVIGTDIVAKANPDGHTLVLVSLRFSVNPSLLKLPYDTVKDFTPVIMTAAVGNVLVVPVKSSMQSVKDVIAAAKQKPNELTFASSGLGGAPHLTGEFFALTTGVKMRHIAYKGGGPAVADLVAGNVSMSFASMTSSFPFIKANRLRALAVSANERNAQLPEVPTMAEAGVANLVVRDWQGILAPRGTPALIVDKLNQALTRILRHPENQERFAAMGLVVIASKSDEFRNDIVSEVRRWAKVVKDADIRAE
jgi:tripartite-type tricarboxylate transporter receptor subunit TctC